MRAHLCTCTTATRSGAREFDGMSGRCVIRTTRIWLGLGEVPRLSSRASATIAAPSVCEKTI
jgi:hypothetical protein